MYQILYTIYYIPYTIYCIITKYYMKSFGPLAIALSLALEAAQAGTLSLQGLQSLEL